MAIAQSHVVFKNHIPATAKRQDYPFIIIQLVDFYL